VPEIEWVRRWKLGFGTKNPWTVSITAREDGLQAAAYETVRHPPLSGSCTT